jgi:hypothetical protein
MAIRNLFTFSSEDRWKSYWKTFLLTGTCLSLLIYGSFYVIDPYDCYPFSIKGERGPVSSDARYFHTLLARSDRFNSAIIGASTCRNLQPHQLNPLFQSTFVNLSFNAASAYEQARMLDLFIRHHAHAKTIIWGLDMVWYKTQDEYSRFARPDEDFPEWLYVPDADRWKQPLAFNLKNFEHSLNQLWFMLGLKHFEYGLDGFTPYRRKPMALDQKRIRIYGAKSPKVKKAVYPPAVLSPEELASLVFPAEAILKASLDRLPDRTEKILFFPPYHYYHQPAEGSREALVLAEFKRRLARLAQRYHNIYILDFMIRSPFTTNDDLYFDIVHTTNEGGLELGDQLFQATQQDDQADSRVLYRSRPSESALSDNLLTATARKNGALSRESP